jgi:hypothetical protein
MTEYISLRGWAPERQNPPGGRARFWGAMGEVIG